MNINRNNYEEYFLLYIDNELSVAGKNMVDAFVADNPDLGEELVMLQQSVLKTETVEFDQKENLLKPQPADELTEEKLLLLLDGELNDTEKNNTLSLINTNPAVKQEWELLQQTKLSPADNIIFDQKLLLYRKETKVVPMPWWRIAAAAVFIGAGLWTTSKYFNTAGKSALPPAETVQAAPGKQSSGNNQNSISIPAGNSNKESAPAAVTVNAGTNTNHSKDETTGKHPVLQKTDAQKDNLTVSTNDPGEPVTGLDALKEINNNDSNKKLDLS